MAEDKTDSKKENEKPEVVKPLPPLKDIPRDKLEVLSEGYEGNDFSKNVSDQDSLEK